MKKHDDYKRTIGALKYLRAWIISFIIFSIIQTFLFSPARVSGKSMYPTLEDGEIGFTNSFLPLIDDLERFDVVVALYKEGSIKEKWVKRIIGLPFDVVEYRNDTLFINGKQIEEPFLDQEYMKDRTNGKSLFTKNFKIILKASEYFLMGDNRPDSFDSRTVGPFTRDQIISKNVYILFPFDKIKVVGNGSE